MFYLFPSPEEEEKTSKQLGKLADGSVPVEELGRYWKLSYNKDPRCEDNIYLITVGGDVLPGSKRDLHIVAIVTLNDAHNSVADMKWRYANLINHTTKDSSQKEVNDATSSRHWVVCKSKVMHRQYWSKL